MRTFVVVENRLSGRPCYHLAGQLNPHYSGAWPLMRLSDAEKVAKPCPICFPKEKNCA